MKNWYKKLNFGKSIILYLVFTLVLLLTSAQIAMAEWQEPGSAPPLEDFYAPITTTAEPQAKEGFLLIDPENYHPKDESSLNFSITKPLVVYGSGVKFSTDYTYNERLIVDEDTLYADSNMGWVGIGTTSQLSGEKLNIVGQTVQIGTSTEPISGRALSSYSADDYGTFVNASSPSIGGVYALNSGDSGQAVYGESGGNNVGVRGESTSGVGIYATTDSSNFGAVYGKNESTGFAGYFDGRLNAVSDLVADVFFPTNLQNSIIPYTSGQFIKKYDIGVWSALPDDAAVAFDGTNIWFGPERYDNSPEDYILFKLNTLTEEITGYPRNIFFGGGCTWGWTNMVTDGRYLYMTCSNTDSLVKFDTKEEVVVDFVNVSEGSAVNRAMEISVINGETYLWVANRTNNKIYKVKAEDMSVDSGCCELDTLFTNVTYPISLEYENGYLWVGAYGSYDGTNAVVRLWADNPNDTENHPPLYFDTTTAEFDCHPHNVFYAGGYIWVSPHDEGNIIRIWADDPYDPRHPIEQFDATIAGGKIKDVIFDGTYLWYTGVLEYKYYRMLAADPTQIKSFDLSFREAYRMIFDGMYFWIVETEGSGGNGNVAIHKFYSGTGWGKANLGSVVQLREAHRYCSVTTTQQCVYDCQCPAAETCDTGNESQSGDIYVDDRVELKKGHCFNGGEHLYDTACTDDSDCTGQCVGGNIRVGDDIEVANNLWGGVCADGITPCTGSADCGGAACYGDEPDVVAGEASCADGDFMAGVRLDASGQITKIFCWEL